MSPQDSQRTRDIARAAKLYTAIHGALKAAPAPMSLTELCGMSGVAELYNKSMLPQKVHAQLRNLMNDKEVSRVERGKYAIIKRTPAPLPAEFNTPEMSLRLQVNKSDKSISFVFQKLSITIKVVE